MGAELERVAGVDVVEAESLAVCDAKWFGELSRASDGLFDPHGGASSVGGLWASQFPSSL